MAKKGTRRKLRQVSPHLPGASAPPGAEMATPQPADAPGPLQAEVAAPPQLPGAPALPGAETAAPGSPHAEMATPRLPAALAPPESEVAPLTEVLGEQQQVATLAQRWRWAALASWPRRWLPAVLGLLRRVASWVAARDLLGHWARRAAPPSRALVGDALGAAVVATCSSARLRPLEAVLSASLAGVEPAASPSEDVSEESGVTASGSLYGDALAAAAVSPTSRLHEDGFLAGVAHAGCASPPSSSAPPLLEVTSEVAVASPTSLLQGHEDGFLAGVAHAACASPSSSSPPPPLEEVTSEVTAMGAGQDQLGKGKQPMGLEQAQVGRRLPVIKVLPKYARARTDTQAFATPPQVLLKHARASQVQEAAEEPDREREIHKQFWSELGECGDDKILCLMCHLHNVRNKKGKKLHKMEKNDYGRHCNTWHGGKGTKCEKKGCQVSAKNKGDIGAHQLYCHRI